MFTYLKKSVRGYYAEFPTKLDSNVYVLGSTYKDFLDDKWVLLSDEQLKFKEENPRASVKQVIEMTLPEPYERTLEDAKREMINTIDNYDNSLAVNGFEFEGVPGKYWLTPLERSDYKQSVESAKILGNDTVSFYVGDIPLTVEVDKAIYLLAVLQDYANKCFMVTKQHKLDVEELVLIEDVDNYPYTEGYPECPKFSLQ